MAQRRMFSKTITNSSQFLMMPQSSQNLYFHLGMNADDDGFCEHFAIMRMTESKPDDLKVLQAKQFVEIFDDKVLVIISWKENNYLRSDRYTPSKYLDIYKKEIKKLVSSRYTSGIPKVDQLETQDRLGKDRLGKDRDSEASSLVADTIKLFEVINPACKQMYGNTTQRKAVKSLLEEYGFDQVRKVIAILPKSNLIAYLPTITTPLQLRDKWASLEVGLRKEKNKNNNNQGLA